MATPSLPANPSIDNPALTPEPIRKDPEPDIPEEPKEDPTTSDSSAARVQGRRNESL